MEKTGILVIGLDGTVTDTRHRDCFITLPQKNWRAWYSHCDQDEAYEDVILAIKGLLNVWNAQLVVLSGRPLRVLAKTKQWLASHGLFPSQILLKPPEESRTMRRIRWKVHSLLRLEQSHQIIAIVDKHIELFSRLEKGQTYFLVPTPGVAPGLAIWYHPFIVIEQAQEEATKDPERDTERDCNKSERQETNERLPLMIQDPTQARELSHALRVQKGPPFPN